MRHHNLIMFKLIVKTFKNFQMLSNPKKTRSSIILVKRQIKFDIILWRFLIKMFYIYVI